MDEMTKFAKIDERYRYSTRQRLSLRRSPNTPPESRRQSTRLAEIRSDSQGSNILMSSATRSHVPSSSSTVKPSSPLTAISEAKDGSICLRVLAKPGAKQSAVTDVGEDYVAIQIGAPARDGQANYELVDYLVTVLQLKKSNISVDKGLRSRIKSVRIVKTGFTPDLVRELFTKELSKNSGFG